MVTQEDREDEPILIIGLTGSIGMGKSTVAKMMEASGIPVHDSDVAVHELMQPDGKANPAIGALFPEAYDKASNEINRQILGRIVFSDPEKKKQLEYILHPLVRESQQEFLNKNRARGAQMAVLDIPLLFETDADKRLDVTLVVSAGSEIQRQRVMARPNMTEEKFEAILESQMPDEEKQSRADFVIDTSCSEEETKEIVANIITELQNRKHTYEHRHIPS